jgi:energy-coupling factor transport system substrate-specific component
MSWQLASFTLLGLALLGGFAWYERSRPSSRTVALVATLAALATLGRIAFAALPSVKPTTDIVLIAGYALGGAPGFMVGAVAALASNLFFGQGPWTPWQMLAWGLVGLAGAALALGGRRIPRIPMALICAAAGFGFGAVMNFYTWTFTGDHSFAGFLLIEGQAFPFDLAAAAGNLLFYLAFGPALVRAVSRFRLRLDIQWGGIVVALLLLTFVPVARADSQRDAIRAQLHYLESAENPDGGFGGGLHEPSAQLFTAWAVIGIAAAGGDPDDGAAWIERHLSQLQGPGDLERTILALHAAHFPLHNLVAELRHDQLPNGSFADQSNLTAFAILALHAAHAPGIPAAATWLEHQQNTDGGFSFATRGSPSDVDATAAAIEALAVARAPQPAIAKAIAFLGSNRNADGGFPDEPGAASDAQSTAWVLQALHAAHATPAGVAYLTRLTTVSGAVDYSRGNSQTPVWVTAQALAALARSWQVTNARLVAVVLMWSSERRTGLGGCRWDATTPRSGRGSAPR